MVGGAHPTDRGWHWQLVASVAQQQEDPRLSLVGGRMLIIGYPWPRSLVNEIAASTIFALIWFFFTIAVIFYFSRRARKGRQGFSLALLAFFACSA
jgi:hypothetical protein